MNSDKFPNLFIIGAMKAGTSSLHEYLHAHPEIYMARFKEPSYFAPHRMRHGEWGQGNPLPEPGIGWYERLFADAGDVRYAGESSTNYTKLPWMPGCPERIHAFNPKARLIYIVRDPTERVISHYWHWLAGHRETRGCREAIRADERYLGYSQYARQLEPYVNVFGRDRIHLLTLEELSAAPQPTLARLFSWLGVDDQVPVAAIERYNVASESAWRVRPGFAWSIPLRRHWRWAKWEQRVPGLVRGAMRRLAWQPLDRDSIAGELNAVREYLQPFQRDQTRLLAELAGRDFPEWGVGE